MTSLRRGSSPVSSVLRKSVRFFISNIFLIKTFQVEILKMVWTNVFNFQALEIIMIIIRQFVRFHPRRMELDFQVCFRVVDRARHRKNSWRQGLTKTKLVDEGGKGAVCWLCEREKTERTWGKERVGTNCENISCRNEKERIRSMCNKTIIGFGFCDIQNNQGQLSKDYQPQHLDLDYSGYHKNLIQ